MRLYKSLDGLKFILFLGVFFFHAGFFPLGWGGVEFYLLISSFLLTNKMLKTENRGDIQIGRMIIKRWKRLSPLFYLVVILLTIYYFFQEHALPEDLWSFFIYGQNFYWLLNETATKVPACFHFWYLTLDIYLFVVWLFVLKYVKREKIRNVLIILLLFSIGYRSICAVFVPNVAFSYTMPWGLFDTFALGSLAAISMREKDSFKKKAVAAFIMGAVLFVISTLFMSITHGVGLLRGVLLFSSAENYGHHPITILILLVMSLFGYAAVWFCINERKHYGILSNDKISRLGTLSYELYVIHFPALYFTKLYVTSNKIAVALIAITVTIILSFLWDGRSMLSLNNQRT